MSVPKIACASRMELQSSPIKPEWIREGVPVARNRVLATSTDKSAWTMQWDCTAGQFIWIYAFDETVHIVEGSVTLTEADGTRHVLTAGDSAFFPRGVTLHWHVEHYVRKLAVCQVPQPAALNILLRFLRKMSVQITSLVGKSLMPQAVLTVQPDGRRTMQDQDMDAEAVRISR